MPAVPRGGIEWPEVDARTGRPSTTETNKSIWTAALRSLIATEGADADTEEAISPALRSDAESLIADVERTSKSEWRTGYVELLRRFGEIMASAPSEGALRMAEAGLEAMNSSLVVVVDDEKRVPAKEAVLTDGAVELRPCETETVGGEGPPVASDARYAMASPHRDADTGGHVLVAGEEMKAQVSKWAEYGCVEPSVAMSASRIAEVDNVRSLVEGKMFVLLGATSAMGPADVLIGLGAKIAAVARPGKKLEALMERARAGPEGAELLVPVLDGQSPGADLINDAPELARWIASLRPDLRPVICNLAYLDGERNVRAGVGTDLITEYVLGQREDACISYVLSPSTVHAVTDEAAHAAGEAYDTAPFWQRMMFSPSNTWKVEDGHIRVLNGLSSLQGPSYALTKTSQQWRAMVSHHRLGRTVSAIFGPPTRTESMVGHAKVAAALEGLQNFPPNIAFDVPCASTLLAALLLHDINFGNEEGESGTAAHPMRLFDRNSAHGGCWRCPFRIDGLGSAFTCQGGLQAMGQGGAQRGPWPQGPRE
eukprot:CAMPEP_0183294524 /NCGR_PEP_ID=MMETSP0160_2-20130417/2827_1 /TAXON_ID=2839 ORGANISM="Odontella Sinensis, Strain Grunow 1884" /NCGR_SAMPLE_ID=MMETSP0160_2 /ASSEMBLY_ACC=CAM_ASM_000250 /LENGTH=540 /DNA_ID=CAMNT_0025455865 /DNA_START=46 /DNA_END=1669 /DNA_ORIENTATION=+